MKKLITLSTIGIIISMMGACAYAPSQAVKDANAAYLHAERSSAPQLAPAELRQAQLAVMEAERADRDDPGGYQSSDLAYIAVRKRNGPRRAATSNNQSARKSMRKKKSA